NTVVPINAGPSLAHLPAKVAASVKAAKVVPPKKGVIVAARLDPSKGTAIKKATVKVEKAKQVAEPVKGVQPPTTSTAQNKQKTAGTTSVATGPAVKPVKPGEKAAATKQTNTAATSTATTTTAPATKLKKPVDTTNVAKPANTTAAATSQPPNTKV